MDSAISRMEVAEYPFSLIKVEAACTITSRFEPFLSGIIFAILQMILPKLTLISFSPLELIKISLSN